MQVVTIPHYHILKDRAMNYIYLNDTVQKFWDSIRLSIQIVWIINGYPISSILFFR